MTNETDTDLEVRANEYARKLGDECLCARTNPLTPAGECISIFCGCHVAESYVSGALSERELITHEQQSYIDRGKRDAAEWLNQSAIITELEQENARLRAIFEEITDNAWPATVPEWDKLDGDRLNDEGLARYYEMLARGALATKDTKREKPMYAIICKMALTSIDAAMKNLSEGQAGEPIDLNAIDPSTANWCQGFCHTCGTGCGQYCEEIKRLRSLLSEGDVSAGKLVTELCVAEEQIEKLKDALSSADRPIMDLLFALRHIKGRPTLKDLIKVARRVREGAREALATKDAVKNEQS